MSNEDVEAIPPSSSPAMLDETTKEYLFSTDEGTLSKASAEAQVPTAHLDIGPEGLSFYNMDLYESRERLDIFTEELSSSRTEDEQFTAMEDSNESRPRTEEEEYDLYTAEVSEMARQYGIWDDKEDMEMGFQTQEPFVMVTQKQEPAVLDIKTWGEEPVKGEPKERGAGEKRDSIHKTPAVDEGGSMEHHEPCYPSEGDEPQSHEQYVGQRQYSEEAFKEEEWEEEGSQAMKASRGDTQIGEFVGFSAKTQEDLTMDMDNPEDAFRASEHTHDLEEEQPGAQAGGEDEVPDVFCMECKIAIRAFDKVFGSHKDHQVTKLSIAAEDTKVEIHKTMCKLEEQIAQMENFASHLEEIFITVEENFGRQEQNLEQHYNEVIQTLTQRYEDKTSGLEDEKKQKLEKLYSQLVNCGKTLDISKDLIEAAQEICRNEDKLAFLQVAVPTVERIEEYTASDPDLKLSASLEFENDAIDFSDVRQMMDSINIVPAPSAPVINPQTPNSSTSTSVRVCWSLFSDDTVEYYELYYKPVLEGTTADENEEQDASMVKVKETYCTVLNLVPNTQYKFWVTALNTTGISPASERAVYMTVPSPPVIKKKLCRSCPNAALIRWESGNTNPVDSYTVELCEISRERSETAVTESIVGIPTYESVIQLLSGRSYLIYVRAVNIGGPSERSDPVIIYTTGTFFRLNEDTAHPSLAISEDGFTMFYGDEYTELNDITFSDNTFSRCVAIMGELIPIRGKHYWEVEVEEHTEYRIGVAYEDTQRNGYLGANNTSWCMRHVMTPSRHKYEFLHNGSTPDIRITMHPKRIGVSLDYETGKLAFFNTGLSQHIYTYKCHFLHYVHPCFALEKPGALTVHNGIEAPEYITFS
ncbi:fibronectin type III and SPRY domain-containing protein 2-like [Acipenser ruthenus]|uniref:fibronectin type III and SPRY domain-containing protein 2-like n=1 Tax=Acipenser ruthenus TaxID=7906 RepID=UPI00145AA371|nr:fibronectin type III and SPRY domain-containing protein 2-like [Acipenser ruthenus]